MRRRDFLTGTASLMISSSTPVWAEDRASKELVLALDQSGSMYHETLHYLIQRDGHVAALQDPLIVQRLVMDQVHVRVVYWAGRGTERELVLGGVRIVDSTDVQRLAYFIKTQTPNVAASDSNTHHHALLEYIRDLPRVGEKLVIDVSTDEEPGSLGYVTLERAEIEKIGGTINVLAIDQTPDWDVVRSLEQNLQTADGFTRAVRSYQEYPKVLKLKILDELMM